jgi:prepilin-type N-terminal cleavage/methylation domain-containing protein
MRSFSEGTGFSVLERGRRPGLSLLEVLIALAIFLVAMGVLGHMINLASDRALEVQQQGEAAQICQAKLAEVVAGAVELVAQPEAPLEEDPSWTWSVEPESTEIPGLWRVHVRVRREQSAGNPIEWVLSQMVLDPSMRGTVFDQPPTSDANADPTPPPATSSPSSASSGSSGSTPPPSQASTSPQGGRGDAGTQGGPGGAGTGQAGGTGRGATGSPGGTGTQGGRGGTGTGQAGGTGTGTQGGRGGTSGAGGTGGTGGANGTGGTGSQGGQGGTGGSGNQGGSGTGGTGGTGTQGGNR